MEIDQFLHNFFSDINIITKTADKGEIIKKLLFLIRDLICVLKELIAS